MMNQTDPLAIKESFRSQHLNLSTEIPSSYGMKRIHVDHEIDPRETEKPSTYIYVSY